MQLTVLALRAVSATFLASISDHQDQDRFIFEKLIVALVLKIFCAFLFFNRMIYYFVHNGRYPEEPAEATLRCRQSFFKVYFDIVVQNVVYVS
jgi:hypothetical protein